MTRGTRLAALVCGSAIVLTMVGVAVAASPTPDPSQGAAVSQDPGATVAASPPAELSAPPSAAPSLAPAAAPSAAPKSGTTSKPAEVAETSDPAEVIATLTGTLTTKTDADGDVGYYIGDVELSVGPPWFWGTKHPLAGLVGQTITVTGHTETGNPAKAGATAKSGPEFEVLTVNGKTVREPGKPAWAGGPKVVGASHPGYAGWSKNHGTGTGNGAKASAKP
jgi:hypothetical protein